MLVFSFSMFDKGSVANAMRYTNPIEPSREAATMQSLFEKPATTMFGQRLTGK
jgi:hypothetical protein